MPEDFDTNVYQWLQSLYGGDGTYDLLQDVMGPGDDYYYTPVDDPFSGGNVPVEFDSGVFNWDDTINIPPPSYEDAFGGINPEDLWGGGGVTLPDNWLDSIGNEFNWDDSISIPPPSYDEAFEGINLKDLWGVDGGNTGGWGSKVYDFLKNAGKAGLGLLNVLSGGSGNMNASTLSNLLGLGGQLASLFQTSAAGKNNQTASTMQQTAEKWMDGIEQQVNAGTMDPYQAVEAIKNMMASLQAGAETEADKRAVAMAGMAASQHIANFQNKQNWISNAQFDPTQDRFGIISNNGVNLPLSETAQQERGQSLMRDLLMNTTNGQAFGSATPAGNLVKPLTDPGERYKQYLTGNEGGNSTTTVSRNNVTAPTFESLKAGMGFNSNPLVPEVTPFDWRPKNNNNLGSSLYSTLR